MLNNYRDMSHIMDKHLNIGMKLKYAYCLWYKYILCCGWRWLISVR